MASALQVERRNGANEDQGVTAPFASQHYSPAEIAALWGISTDTARRIFESEPGVLQIGDSSRMGRKRRYVTLRIPEAVAERVHRKLSRV